jgi:outer membrane protein assembly factor BamB
MRIISALLLISFFLLLPLHASVDWSYSASGSVMGKPIISGNNVIFASSDGKIYALDSAAGKLQWRVDLGGKTSIEPAKAGEYIIAATDAGRIAALDGSGKIVWEKNTTRAKSITALGSGVFVLSNASVSAHDAATGRLLWSYNANFTDYFSTIGKTEGSIIAGIGNDIVAFEPLKGNMLWRQKVGTIFGSRPVATSGAIFFGTTDGKLYSVNSDSGVARWAFQTNGWVQSTPYASRDAVVFGSNDGNVYSINPITGQILWKFKTGEGVWSEPVLYSTNGARIIFVGSHDRKLYALDSESGRLLYSFASSDWIGSPVMLSDSVIFGSRDGRVYSLSAAPGCSFDNPVDGSLIGDAEMELRGRAFAIGGVQRVEVRQNGGQWKAAVGTEDWSVFLDTATIPESVMKFECRTYGNDGRAEDGPLYSSSGAVKSSDARPLEMTISAPVEAEAGKPFEVTVKNSFGTNLPRIAVVAGDKIFEGDSPLQVTLGLSGNLEVKKRGYDTEIVPVSVKGTDMLLYGLIVIVLAGAAWFFVLRKRK